MTVTVVRIFPPYIPVHKQLTYFIEITIGNNNFQL